MQPPNAEGVDSKDHEGIIRCIFFSEFHHIVGPKITCQVSSREAHKHIQIHEKMLLVKFAIIIVSLRYPTTLSLKKYSTMSAST